MILKMKERKIIMNNGFNSTKVITGVNTRWSYCNVWEPKSINGGTPKYSVSLIIPKSDTVTVDKTLTIFLSSYSKKSSSSLVAKSSSALAFPPRLSPSLIFCKLFNPQAILLLPLELKAYRLILALPYTPL